jgi:hypothetical protein
MGKWLLNYITELFKIIKIKWTKTVEDSLPTRAASAVSGTISGLIRPISIF